MSWTLPWRRSARPEPQRWVVVDVESSGLDPSSDRLLAIAGVAVLRCDPGRPRIALGDSFEVMLKQPPGIVDKDNILLHGIGLAAQRGGVDPALALTQFEAWVDGAPLVAFHAAFDMRMIRRAAEQFLSRRLQGDWLDLAQLAPIWRPEVRAQALDDWLDQLELKCEARHQAAADALVTAQLLVKLWPVSQTAADALRFHTLQRLCQQRRWLPSHP